MAITTVKGMSDILPSEITLWQEIESIGRALFESFGYREIRTPILEKTELFARSIGEETDIVGKEMYTFTDKNGDSLTLRPEATASVVRSYIQNNLGADDPITKLFYWGPMFRRERPQKGRSRQFQQFGVEVFGISEPEIDAEMIFMLKEFYQKLGLKDILIRINSLGCKGCRSDFRKALVTFFEKRSEKLCPDCQRRLITNPLRILDCKVEECREISKESPSSLDLVCDDCRVHLDGVVKGLELLKVPVDIDPRIVRGLDYYTRTAFEFTSRQLGAQDAVGGGGRYDDLVEQLGGAPTPAIGFAGGIDRLTLLLPPKEVKNPDFYLVWLGAKAKEFVFYFGNQLRLMGAGVEVSYEEKSIKSQMRRANKLKAKFSMVIGDDELKSKKGKLKQMSSGKETEVDLKNIDQLMKVLKES